jgi:hypothetical protein
MVSSNAAGAGSAAPSSKESAMSKPARNVALSLAGEPFDARVSEVIVEQHTILLHATGLIHAPAGVFFPVTVGDGEVVRGLVDLTDAEIRQALLDSAINQACLVAYSPAGLALIQSAADLDAEELENRAEDITDTLTDRTIDKVQEVMDNYRFDPDA